MANFYAQYPSSGGGSNPSIGTNGTTAPLSSTEVGFVDNSTGFLAPFSGTNAATGPNVAVTSSALPTGGATSALQVTGNAVLGSILLDQTNGSQLTGLVGLSLISTVNSSNTNLAGNAVFTGTSEDVSGYAEIRVFVFSDQASATDGLSVQQSSNGTNWDSTDVYTIAASTGKVYGFGVGARFCRVVYTNGATPTGAFRLQTIYHEMRTKPSSIRSQDGYSNENDLEEVAAFGMVWNGTTWDRQKGDATSGAFVQIKGGGTAGTPAGAINTIQGVSGGQAVPISGSISITGTSAQNLTQVGGAAIALGAAAAASSLPVALANEDVQDLYVTGQATQTATVNNILTVASGTAATDLTGYRSFAIQVVSTGTGGTFIFETSNDNVNFQVVPLFNQALLTSVPIITAITATASQFIYVGAVSGRYFRLRIATLITGGSIQAFSKFSQTSFTPVVQNIAQSVAANLNATVSATNLSTNVAQLGAVAVLLGQGVTGTGSLRNTPVVTATATLTNVVGSATTVSLLASNVNRSGAAFFNDSTAVLYLKFGATASTTSYTVQIPALGYYELPVTRVYTGAIDGIWSAANGNVRITELA